MKSMLQLFPLTTFIQIVHSITGALGTLGGFGTLYLVQYKKTLFFKDGDSPQWINFGTLGRLYVAFA